MSDDNRTSFLAIISPVLAGIKVTGNGDGMRVQFDIPETEIGAAAKLLLMREMVLKVTVEEAKQTKAKSKKRY